MSAYNFAYKFELLAHYLKSFAMKLTRDKHLAEDLFQETALSAFRNKDKFIPDTNMKAWLSTIMKNAFINSFRKKKRQGTLFDRTPENFWINSGGAMILNEGEDKVNQDDIWLLIEGLDEKLRKPFILNYKGYKYHEIAEEETLPIGTIKSRIFTARKLLKEKLSAYNIDSIYN